MSMNAIGLVCKDLGQTLEFYKLFGLEFKDFGEGNHFECTLDSGVRMMLDSLELIQSINSDFKYQRGGSIVLCFEQKSPQNVDEVFKTVIDSGFESVKEPWDAFWGQRYSSVLDPDGNQIDIFASL